MKAVDLSMVKLDTEQVNSTFGDASVIRPDGARPGGKGWPAHWAEEELDYVEFHRLWREWLATLPPE